MQLNRFHILTLLLVLCGSCIEPFTPRVEGSQEVLVINGFVSDQAGPHMVEISRSTPYNYPSNEAETGCVVTVEDETGNMAAYVEISPGVYEATLEPEFLRVGHSYALIVITSDGNEYRSDYETMLACSPVDSVYFEMEEKPTTDPEITLNGLQFYVDVKGTTETASNYHWVVEETWMYTAPHIANYYFDGTYLIPIYPTTYTCYMTKDANGLYSASTRFLSVNHLNRNRLHYVTDETDRLEHKYSVLVKQHSLSTGAFEYWDRMEAQTSKGSGLYETQPTSTVGNIYNVNDPAERVLGYFYATQIREKRVSFRNSGEFTIRQGTCPLDTVFAVNDLDPEFPYVISIDPSGMGGPPYLVGDDRCFDCRYYGGTITLPDFW